MGVNCICLTTAHVLQDIYVKSVGTHHKWGPRGLSASTSLLYEYIQAGDVVTVFDSIIPTFFATSRIYWYIASDARAAENMILSVVSDGSKSLLGISSDLLYFEWHHPVVDSQKCHNTHRLGAHNATVSSSYPCSSSRGFATYPWQLWYKPSYSRAVVLWLWVNAFTETPLYKLQTKYVANVDKIIISICQEFLSA